MPIYKYKGYDLSGRTVNESIHASDELEFKVKVKQEGIKLYSYKVVAEKRRSNFLTVSNKVNRREFLTFCDQFSIMINAGCTIAECLNTLRNQAFSTYFKNVISDVYDAVLKGNTLSDAFKLFPKVFPSFFCSMMYVGELTGKLSDVLQRAAKFYANSNRVKSKMRSALSYPIFLLIIVFAIFILLMTFVVPNFANTLTQYGGQLPALTVAVLGVSNFITSNFLFIILGIIAIVCLIVFGGKTKKGKYIIESFLLHLPIIKNVKKNGMTSQFSTAFAILINSGLQIVDILKEMPRIINSEYFSKHFKPVIEDVNNGVKLSRALNNTKLFPLMMIQMIKVGEDTSSLGPVSEKTGDYFQEVLEESIKRATSLLEPLIIVVMGGLVLIIILSVMLPIFELTNAPLAGV